MTRDGTFALHTQDSVARANKITHRTNYLLQSTRKNTTHHCTKKLNTDREGALTSEGITPDPPSIQTLPPSAFVGAPATSTLDEKTTNTY